METAWKETGDRNEALAVRFTRRECLICEPSFYARVITVVVPMIIQNTLTNIVGLLDNVMVGQVGTIPMSSVAIVNQILFIFYLCVFGALAGAGIYSTQYFGKGDMEGVRASIRFKLITAAVIVAVAILVLLSIGGFLISLYISEDTLPAAREETIRYGLSYLRIMLIGLVPFGLTQCYGSAMRESGKTTLPMIASMTAMVVNFILNALLIFGMFGLPVLGVLGAAIATVASRFVELSIVLVGAHIPGTKYPFFKGLYRTFAIPRDLAGKILLKSLPLFANEFLWSLAQAFLLQAYSLRSLQVIAAMNISGTISQIFNEVFFSIGVAAGIIVGQELGADRLVSARRTAWRMAVLSVASTFVMGTLLSIAAPFIPRIYNVEPEIKVMATHFIWIWSACMPIHAYAHSTYFTLRSGGKTLITFVFDSCFAWVVTVPAAYLLSRFTVLPVEVIYAAVMLLEFLKCVVGFIMIGRGIWVRNIVKNEA